MIQIIIFTSLEESQNQPNETHFVQKSTLSQTYIKVTARQESKTYINSFEFQFHPTSNVSKLNSKKSFCETNLGQDYLL